MPTGVYTRQSGYSRFKSNYTLDKTTNCWNYNKGLNAAGYGRIQIARRHMLAHRYSYMIHKGFCGERHVLHTCDNPGCVNPEHLFLGTNQDNVDDRVRKDRSYKPRGELAVPAKLKDADIIEIRKRLALGHTQEDIAKDYGVSRGPISAINRGITWKHIK